MGRISLQACLSQHYLTMSIFPGLIIPSVEPQIWWNKRIWKSDSPYSTLTIRNGGFWESQNSGHFDDSSFPDGSSESEGSSGDALPRSTVHAVLYQQTGNGTGSCNGKQKWFILWPASKMKNNKQILLKHETNHRTGSCNGKQEWNMKYDYYMTWLNNEKHLMRIAWLCN